MKNEINPLKYLNSTHPWKLEEITRVNHYDCPAGTDIRQRLYIRAVSPAGSYICYCHNCGRSGGHWTVKGYSSITSILESIDGHEETSIISDGATSAIYDIEQNASPIKDLRIKTWLYKYDVFEEDWERMKLSQYGNEPMLIYPVGTSSYQIRYMNNKSFTTFWNKGDLVQCALYHPIKANNDVICLTEDCLSAYRVMRDVGIPAISLLGTSVSEYVRGYVTNYSAIHIWLDGDTTGRRKSISITEKLPHVTYQIVTAEKSPKEYSPEHLKELAKFHGIK